MEIPELVKILAQYDEEIYSLICTVESVNDNDRSCTCKPVRTNKAMIKKVKLSAKYGAASIYYKPKIGSYVMVSFVNNVQGFVTAYSDIELMSIVIDNSSLTVDPSKFEFNGGTNGGLVKVADLVMALNRLESRMTSHQHLYVTPAGSPAPTVADPSTNTPLTPSTSNQLSNDKVTH